jgi:hypothetical protein
MVTYRPDQRGQDVSPGGVYMITARLPESADGQFEYRIKNLNEQHERVVKERELRGG